MVLGVASSPAPLPVVQNWAAVPEGLEGLGAASSQSRTGSWVGQGVAKLSSAMALQTVPTGAHQLQGLGCAVL